ncbi:hypothetical protein GWG54_19925 [Natronococcus sp. JC468]|uniref:DUF7344 domain-containing protein n=1 Tax=Natronococcus sp. JC468 TaxID=1961921 RepID=UPI00143AF577|nr:hypothetical protein [Natronococcus sp. JC468]NKE38017.1 hypothetical protein [Natronococcus sp. JC468]
MDSGMHNSENIDINSSERFDEILTVLSNTQRRQILYQLRNQGATSRTKMARRLAAWKYEISPEEVPDKVMKAFEIELYHNHLPKLKEAHLIEYDKTSKQILVDDLSTFVEMCIDCYFSIDLPSYEN